MCITLGFICSTRKSAHISYSIASAPSLLFEGFPPRRRLVDDDYLCYWQLIKGNN